jgi:CheY-like chemotaxis protein
MGKMRVTFGAHAPREIARQAVELLRPRAQEKSLPLHLALAQDVPDEICTDGMRLRQILLNLLANAIKFTTQGSVGLSVHLGTPRTDGLSPLEFDVTDTGMGIAPEHLRRIFEPFYRVEQDTPRRVGGVGLGLAIARQLAIQMGGELTVKSTPGAGSAFTLTLPLKPPAAEPGTDLNTVPTAALAGRILLAEDTPNIRLLVKEYLTRAGARVTAVADGAAAVEHMRQTTEGEPFDLILLDLHMPLLDGPDTLRQIRALGYAGPIVGLTAGYSDKPDAQWTAEGWTAMAAKPIDRQTFIPLLAQLMGTHASPGVPPGAAPHLTVSSPLSRMSAEEAPTSTL